MPVSARWLMATERSIDHPAAFRDNQGGSVMRKKAVVGVEPLEDRSTPSSGTLVGAAWEPVAGNWNGGGRDTVGAYDPATATWFIKMSNGPGAPDIAPFQYGAPGWVAVTGDWDGDGRDGIGVFDPNTATWYLKNTP